MNKISPLATLNGIPYRLFEISYNVEQIEVTSGGLFGPPDTIRRFIAGPRIINAKFARIVNGDFLETTTANDCKLTIRYRRSGRVIYSLISTNSYTYLEKHD